MSRAWGAPGRGMDPDELRRFAVADVLEGRGSVPVIAALWGVFGADLAEWVAEASTPAETPPDGGKGGDVADNGGSASGGPSCSSP